MPSEGPRHANANRTLADCQLALLTPSTLIIGQYMRICSRCHSTNPDEAAYCYFDGFSLLEPGAAPALSRLPHDFVFASGRHCRTFEELALACHEEWDTAR